MLSFYAVHQQKQKNMASFTTPLPLMFIFITAFGVLMHDSKVDHAGSVALNPAHYSSFAVADAVSKSNEHVHVERVSFSGGSSSNVPKIQPRDDDRRYIQSKKVSHNSGNGNGLWPSA